MRKLNSLDKFCSKLKTFRKFTRSTLKSSVGISLIQIMVAMGVMAGISVALMRIQQTSTQTSAGAALATDTIGLFNRISQVLLDSSGCAQTLNPLGAISVNMPVPSILDKNGNPVVTIGQEVVDRRLRVKDMTVTDFVPDGAIVAPATTIRATVAVEVELEKKKGPNFDWQSIKKTYNMIAKIDTSLTILECYDAAGNSIESAVKEACEKIDYDDDGTFDFQWDMTNQKCIPIDGFCTSGGGYVDGSGPIAVGNPVAGGAQGCPGAVGEYTPVEVGTVWESRVVTRPTTSTGGKNGHGHTYQVDEPIPHKSWICLKCNDI
jgi:hypothetical protein